MFKILLSKEVYADIDEIKIISKLFLYEIWHNHPLLDRGFVLDDLAGIYKVVFEQIIENCVDSDDIRDIVVSETGETVILTLTMGELTYGRD